MYSIRSKITTAFIAIVTVMILMVVFIIAINSSLLSEYKKINENIIYEQNLKDNVWLLIEENYKGFTSSDYSKYDAKLIDVRKIESNLDLRFSDPSIDKEIKLAYRSTKNSLNVVINNIEEIKKNNKNVGSISNLTSSFNQSVSDFEFVKQNISDLLILETKNIANLTLEIEKKQTSLYFFVFFTIFFVIFMLSIFLVIFSKKITKPITDLSDIAQKISNGNLSLKIDKSLLDRKDEIGILSISFDNMILKLSEKIMDFDISNKELDIKVKEITQNNIELENNKVVIQNLLEDFEEEKNNAEKLVVIRTKELSDEKARLLASINSLTMGFAIVDPKGNFMINNPSIFYILDVIENIKSLDEISTILDIKGESLLKRLEKCVVDKCIIEMNELMFGKKYLRLFLTPVFSLDSVCIGGVLLIEDVTEAKVLERSRDEFFAVASHELRTPLTAIRGNTEMILTDYKEKIQDIDVKEMLTDIDEASIRLIGIVNDFLEVSRLEQGNISIKNTKFDMLDVTKKVIDSLNNEASKKNLSLKIITPKKSLPEIYSDKDKIEEVLFNLVGNSIKFTESGSVSVSFDIVDNKFKVLVSDTGKGISLKNESLLFRKFQPAGDDMLVRDVTKSTGLGLYISKMMIEKMGGNIGLEKSEQGVGSVFFFTIPIVS